MNNIEAYLYDLDGTLLDTYKANWKAYKDSFDEIGYPITQESYKECYGLSFKQMINTVYPTIPESKKEEIKIRKNINLKKYVGEIIINKPMYDFIKNVSKYSKIGLVSSSSKNNVIYLLEHFNLMRCFDVIITGDDVKNHKPSPEPYLQAAMKLNVNPHKCIVFEDSSSGCESAISAGMGVIKVTMNV